MANNIYICILFTVYYNCNVRSNSMSVSEIVFYGFSHTLLKKMYSIPSHYKYSSVFNLRLSLTSFEGLQLFKHCIKPYIHIIC